MNELVRDTIRLAVFMACTAMIYGTGVLIRRSKQDSLRWQRRTEFQQKLLSRIPGAILAMAIYATFIFLSPL